MLLAGTPTTAELSCYQSGLNHLNHLNRLNRLNRLNPLNPFTMFHPYLAAALLIVAYMILWFFLAVAKKDNGIVDVAWGIGFVLVFWSQHYLFDRPLLMGIMVTLLGFRLAVHIFLRNRGRGEDWRYRQWREAWGRHVLVRSFLQVFMLQGFFMWVIALPLMEGHQAAGPMHWTQWTGMCVWAFGFAWEAIGDWQLLRFKSNPANKGKIMTTGLWHFSRHPNYFGEIVLWWGIFIFTLPYGTWWLNIIGPLTLTWLLLRVSGVPMLERKYANDPIYQAYIHTTNALLPGPKRK